MTIKNLIEEKLENLKNELSKYEFDENYFNYNAETIYNYAICNYGYLNKPDLKVKLFKDLKPYLNDYSDNENQEILKNVFNFIIFKKKFKYKKNI
jgi:hypothetical protein